MSAMKEGKVYLMFGANGQTMQEIETDGMHRGQVVSYGDQANPRHDAVVVEDEASSPHGYKCLFVDDLHRGEVSRTVIDGPGGWQDENRDMAEAEICNLERAAGQKAQTDAERREIAQQAAERKRERGKAAYEAARPAWAKAAIVAEYKIDDSDVQSDYFATKTGRRVFLAWSKTTRNNFQEMRKAALKSAETAHMGPGKDVYKPIVVIDTDHVSNGAYYHSGQPSPWHSELDGGCHDRVKFSTEAAAQKYIDDQEPLGKMNSGGTEVFFSWTIDHESLEHRDYGSGCRGYVLGAGDYRTGWIVRKVRLDWDESGMWDIFAPPEEEPQADAEPEPEPAQAQTRTDWKKQAYGYLP